MIDKDQLVNVVVSCKACSSTDFFQKKCQKRGRNRVTPGWTDISGPGPVSFSSKSSMSYIMLTIPL